MKQKLVQIRFTDNSPELLSINYSPTFSLDVVSGGVTTRVASYFPETLGSSNIAFRFVDVQKQEPLSSDIIRNKIGNKDILVFLVDEDATECILSMQDSILAPEKRSLKYFNLD